MNKYITCRGCTNESATCFSGCGTPKDSIKLSLSCRGIQHVFEGAISNSSLVYYQLVNDIVGESHVRGLIEYGNDEAGLKAKYECIKESLFLIKYTVNGREYYDAEVINLSTVKVIANQLHEVPVHPNLRVHLCDYAGNPLDIEDYYDKA